MTFNPGDRVRRTHRNTARDDFMAEGNEYTVVRPSGQHTIQLEGDPTPGRSWMPSYFELVTPSTPEPAAVIDPGSLVEGEKLRLREPITDGYGWWMQSMNVGSVVTVTGANSVTVDGGRLDSVESPSGLIYGLRQVTRFFDRVAAEPERAPFGPGPYVPGTQIRMVRPIREGFRVTWWNLHVNPGDVLTILTEDGSTAGPSGTSPSAGLEEVYTREGPFDYEAFEWVEEPATPTTNNENNDEKEATMAEHGFTEEQLEIGRKAAQAAETAGHCGEYDRIAAAAGLPTREQLREIDLPKLDLPEGIGSVIKLTRWQGDRVYGGAERWHALKTRGGWHIGVDTRADSYPTNEALIRLGQLRAGDFEVIVNNA